MTPSSLVCSGGGRGAVAPDHDRSGQPCGSGGAVGSFTGDGIMAVFGAPTALEDHAFRACLAALGVQEEAKRLAVDIQERDGIDLRMRVGLNSGQADAAGGAAVPGMLGRPRNGGQRGPGRGADHPHFAFTHEIGQRVKCLVDVGGRVEAVPLVLIFRSRRGGSPYTQPERQRGPLPGCL
jgi:Adenylate and Guanylate cyclase catalytic domain